MAVKLIVTALNRLASALFASVGNIAFWMLVGAHTAVLLRVGYDLTADVQKHVARNVVYGAASLSTLPDAIF
jgi:hypothetical protein